MQIEVIKLRDILQVDAAPGFVPGVVPPTLIVKGPDFTTAEKVFLNGFEVESFQIIDRGTIHAVVPPGNESELQSLIVVSRVFDRLTAQTRISYEVGDAPQSVSGIVSLVQHYTKWLLQTPGSDILSPQRGGGLQKLLSKLPTTDHVEPILAELSRAVLETTKQMQTAQATAVNLPPDERLLRAGVVTVLSDIASQSVSVRLQVVSFAGSEATASLLL